MSPAVDITAALTGTKFFIEEWERSLGGDVIYEAGKPVALLEVWIARYLEIDIPMDEDV